MNNNTQGSKYYTILSIGFSGWPNQIAVVAAFQDARPKLPPLQLIFDW